MNVPVLGQHDGRWAGQRVGTGVFDLVKRVLINTSIGGYGCLVTCITMKNLYYGGGEGMVNNIDDIFTNEGIYVGTGLDGKQHRSPALGCNMVDWNAIGRVLPNCHHVATGYYDEAPADLGRIRAAIAAGNPVTLEVRWKGQATAMHFVEAVDFNDHDILVNDPETGRPQWFGSRLFGTGDAARDILKAHFFEDGVPNTPPPIVPPAPAPAAPSNPEPGRGSGPDPVPEPPKEEEVTQAQHESAMNELKQLYEGKLLDQAKQYEAQLTALNGQIKTLTDELAKWAPDYVRSWADGPIQDVLTNQAFDLIDFSGKVALIPMEANTIVTVRGSLFTVNGKPYYRTKASVEGGYYYGVPAEDATLYQAPAAAGPALDLRPQLNASQQFHAMMAESWLGRLISKIFGGSK